MNIKIVLFKIVEPVKYAIRCDVVSVTVEVVGVNVQLGP